MALAALQNYPTDPTEFAEWAHAHAAHHADILRRIFEVYGESLTSYVLDPMDPEDMVTWSTNHRIMHREMNELLEIVGGDISDLDWRNPSGAEIWLQRNWINHAIVGQILEIG